MSRQKRVALVYGFTVGLLAVGLPAFSAPAAEDGFKAIQNEFGSRITQLDEKYFPKTIVEEVKYGPGLARKTVIRIELDPNTKKVARTVAENGLGVKTTLYKNGLPVSAEEVLKFGPKDARVRKIVFEYDPQSRKLARKISSTPLEQVTTFLDESGVPFKEHAVKTFGPKDGRVVDATLEVEKGSAGFETPLCRKRTEKSKLAERVILYNAQGLPGKIQTQESLGPTKGRQTTIEVLANTATGYFMKTAAKNGLGTSLTWYDGNGLPVRAEETNVYGPELGRAIQKEFVCNPGNGLVLRTRAISKLQTVWTLFDDEGMPKEERIQRVFGPEMARESTVDIKINPETGLRAETIEVNKLRAIRTWYDANGLPTREERVGTPPNNPGVR